MDAHPVFLQLHFGNQRFQDAPCHIQVNFLAGLTFPREIAGENRAYRFIFKAAYDFDTVNPAGLVKQKIAGFVRRGTQIIHQINAKAQQGASASQRQSDYQHPVRIGGNGKCQTILLLDCHGQRSFPKRQKHNAAMVFKGV
jgi:hypothetical protein